MSMQLKPVGWVGIGIIMALTPTPLWAHTGSKTGGFTASFEHPILGLDHLVSMVAVGLWGAMLGPPALWVLPVAFPMVMVPGGLANLMGLPILGVEVGMVLSAIVIGILVMLEKKIPL